MAGFNTANMVYVVLFKFFFTIPTNSLKKKSVLSLTKENALVFHLVLKQKSHIRTLKVS